MIDRIRPLVLIGFLSAVAWFFLRNAAFVWAGPNGSSQTLYLPLLHKSPPTPTPEPPPDPNNWLEYVNYFRSLAGLPPVTEDATLNNNCWEHARYMAENNHLTHDQDPSLPFASPAGQICAQNGNAWMGSAFFQPYWEVHHSIEGWMGSVGHRAWMLYPTTPTFGYGFYTASNNRAAAALDVLSKADFGADLSYPGWPVIYPASGQTDVPPTPYPITIFWRYFGPSPVLLSTSLTTQAGASIPHTANTTLPVGHEGIQILPTQALPANTTFLVSVTGTYDTTPFTYTWQFSTGSTMSALSGPESRLNETPTDR